MLCPNPYVCACMSKAGFVLKVPTGRAVGILRLEQTHPQLDLYLHLASSTLECPGHVAGC